MTNYTIEMEMRVFDDDSGNYWAVKDDVDGLGLVEFSSHDNGGDVITFTMPFEAVEQFYKMLKIYLDFKAKTV